MKKSGQSATKHVEFSIYTPEKTCAKYSWHWAKRAHSLAATRRSNKMKEVVHAKTWLKNAT